MNRRAGILMPISALPSPYGIGTLGKEACRFIDFLEKAGQSYWQILPTGPTGYGDSPYQSFSAFAGNPYFIDLDLLKKDGLLKAEEYRNIDWGSDPQRVDYGTIYNHRFAVLHLAADRLRKHLPDDYEDFCRQNAFWLDDYALFMAEKEAHQGVSFMGWEPSLRRHNPKAVARETERLADQIEFWKLIQYLFRKQWNDLRDYAHHHGIKLIGDVPIYVSPDSSDLWGHPDLFQLDRSGKPTEVAGCPPDGFSADGQLWGNPLYNWNRMKKDGYQWWAQRIAYQFTMIDVLRIDHFRGFESYYAIPYGETTARNGRWKKGPGIAFFKTMEQKLGHLDIIAEDLGFLTPEVIQMVKDTGYPGMKVLEFAFDPRDTGSGYLPHKFINNCVVYTGTHDNETVMGWMENSPRSFSEHAIDYLHLDEKEGYNWGFIRAAYMSVADLAVMQFQDLLGLGDEARFNVPSTTGNNWVWRAKKDDFTFALS
ncbi:MAG TPA: 4-alpha-glucanotransferase, partial [Erysipelotrichaceae bacterium]|nr:4-alpha-glucanotransferase [Erysipelotrichaceae bacterium]